MPFHIVTIGCLALGDLVALFAEKLVGDWSFAFLMQHSKADFSLYCDRDCPYGNVDQADADAAGPCWMAWYRFEALFFFGRRYLKFGRL